MLSRALLVGVFFICSVTISSANQIVYNGALTTSDFFAQDASGAFYYDVFDLKATTASNITISLQAGPLLSPWFARWDTVLLPAPYWPDTPVYSSIVDRQFDYNPGTLVTLTPFTATAGTVYQIAVTPEYYLPTDLDSYTITVTYDSPGGTVSFDQVTVPEPSSLILLGAGFVGYALLRRRTKR